MTKVNKDDPCGKQFEIKMYQNLTPRCELQQTEILNEEKGKRKKKLVVRPLAVLTKQTE